jgi:hypothetical protein
MRMSLCKYQDVMSSGLNAYVTMQVPGYYEFEPECMSLCKYQGVMSSSLIAYVTMQVSGCYEFEPDCLCHYASIRVL